MFVENFICSAIFIMTKIWDSKKKHSIFFLFLVKTKSYWKNCLEVQEYAHRRVMDMDGVLISCKNKQGWIINHLQHVLVLLLFFVTLFIPILPLPFCWILLNFPGTRCSASISAWPRDTATPGPTSPSPTAKPQPLSVEKKQNI